MYHTITPLKDDRGEVTHFIATSKDMTQQKILEERINYLAYYDALTDLPNRSLFTDRLRLLRCDMGQGFYFSKPLPGEEAKQLLV